MEQLHVGQHQYRFDENEIGRWTNVLNGRVIIARKPLVQWQCFEEAYNLSSPVVMNIKWAGSGSEVNSRCCFNLKSLIVRLLF